VFTIAGISDMIDGFIARRMKQESELGIIIDPIADKL
jgi:phosphatidylglycerophosphate synthase